MATSEAQVKSRIIEVLEEWARWRKGSSARGRLGFGETVIARMMDGIGKGYCPECEGEGMALRERKDGSKKRDICTECKGSGRVKIDPIESHPERACHICETVDKSGRKVSTGEINGKTCHKCRGSGRVPGESIHHKVNPALIHGTKHGSNPTEDAFFIRVEAAICALPELHQLVIFQEYCRIGRQEDKCDRIGIGRHKYLVSLSEAHERLEKEIGL